MEVGLFVEFLREEKESAGGFERLREREISGLSHWGSRGNSEKLS